MSSRYFHFLLSLNNPQKTSSPSPVSSSPATPPSVLSPPLHPSHLSHPSPPHSSHHPCRPYTSTQHLPIFWQVLSLHPHHSIWDKTSYTLVWTKIPKIKFCFTSKALNSKVGRTQWQIFSTFILFVFLLSILTYQNVLFSLAIGLNKPCYPNSRIEWRLGAKIKWLDRIIFSWQNSSIPTYSTDWLNWVSE